MKILIADFDLFKKIGGGQTFYRQIIEKNPHLEFYYLINQENTNNPRPKNANPIPYQPIYEINDLNYYLNVNPPRWTYRSFTLASNIANSVKGYEFDVVDAPDYEQYTLFLRPALEYHGVKCNKVALSLHGKISTTLRMDWFGSNEVNIPLDLEEKMQFKTADIRYGISKSYLQEWRELVNVKSHYFNPLHFIDLPKPQPLKNIDKKANLYFIGRTEKRKGADIFVNLVWWLSPHNYSEATIIGPHSYSEFGQSSQDLLQEMINKRLVNIEIQSSKPRKELKQIFAQPAIIFLPSRYDTLNLLALESLFSGCPTAIGSGAGVCQFLEENFPQLPWIKIDVENTYECLPKLADVLENYQEYREKLNQALIDIDTSTNDPNLTEIYQADSNVEKDTALELKQWYLQLIDYWQHRPENKNIIKNNATKLMQKVVRPTVSKLKNKATNYAENNRASQLIKSPFLASQYHKVFTLSEQTELEIEKKLQQVWNFVETVEPEAKGIKGKIQSAFRIDRVRVWREIARLERMRNNDLVAATYLLRSMRTLGYDKFNELPYVLKILEEKGFKSEAKATEVMFKDINQQTENALDFLNTTYTNLLKYDREEYEIIDDRRDKNSYKVSVIVSLYNAAPKLPLFLWVLAQQTLAKTGDMEVILMDSGSPDEEYQVFLALADELKLPIVYFRSHQRETIQKAWNRAILEVRSHYITFLGVDETIIPECLEVLAEELDKDEETDWVIAHSLVTEVDLQGNHFQDIMLYNRANYDQNLEYLETCYLSLVGGLYRKNIHDRYGYYDPTYRGAGDTEFKNRVLPHIKTKMVNRVLGLFWNYPDARTTQSPMAEVEDIRAWYLHRSLGGVKYAFANKNPDVVEEFLYHALAYRKSYCGHISSDIEYAYNLCQFLAEIKPTSPLLQFKPSIEQLLTAYRQLDWLENTETFTATKTLWKTRQLAKNTEDLHRKIALKLGNGNFNPNYDIFHDNRHEQHANLWKTELSLINR
ncbi:glycosyltransferase [Cyanobacterium aponinum]|uniref:Glycosyltransferase n=1 Tax=Cyanobacterium aponinum 0216 TaxID=2676140 RepID=A0A844GTX4_9CHRO|nr:glycosyltransferase [Cyanobacterium aponinum]MTF39947.1 glycosyltransferase [Cyanobacterium aponinum 0216]